MGLNVGIIGYGGFGRFLHRAWSAVDGAVVTDVADLSPTRVPPGVHSHMSWLDLFDSRRVDVVSIATPPSSHAEIAIAAVERGIHVLVEKPLATSLSDAQSILDARNSSGRIATVNFMLRFNPIISTIHDWCRAGVFGSLQRVVVENYAQGETLGPDHWFWDEAVSGGILVEHGVHFFDIVNGCTQAPVSRVDHRSWSRNPDMADRVFALVEYDDGLVASHYHAFNRLNEFERTSIRFIFDAAQVDIEGWIPMQGRVLALTNDGSRGALTDLPNLNIIRERQVDASRGTALATGTSDQGPVDTIVSADFALDGSKEDAYQAALRALMRDLIEAVRNPDHVLGVSLEDGVEAIRVAMGETQTDLGSDNAVFLQTITEHIDMHLGDSSFGVEWLADEVGVSHRHLRRRLEEVVGEGPAELIRRLRLERASQLLAAGSGNVAEVAYSVGFKSPSHFSAAFRKAFGISPSEHIEKR